MAQDKTSSKRNVLGRSSIFTPEVINDIHVKAELGRYRMRGFSMFKKIPHWDELMFLPGTLTRFVIEGYREKCETKTVVGARFASHPLGRGRHDPARARPVHQVVLPGHPEPVRVQPASPHARRRRRVLYRAGLQGRTRRPPDGTEGDRAGGRDALAPRRDRPAQPGPPSGLAGPRRPVAEGPGDPRGHRLPGPDPAEAGRGPGLRRRPDGGQV